MEVKNFLPVIYFVLGLSLVIGMTGYAVEGEVPSSVNVDGIRILAETFNGTTTSFENLNATQIQNMSNLILERANYGKIIFSESVNLTLIADVDRIVDFDSDLNITDNLINIDSTQLPSMDKSATISSYNLTFTDPQIMKGGVLCTDCTELSYSSGTIVFTTTTFTSVYYIRETPVDSCGNGICDNGETYTTCPADCDAPDDGDGGGGGGGGGTPSTNVTVPVGHDFYIAPEFFTLKMNKGEYFQKNIVVVNNGTQNLGINVVVTGVSDFVFPQINYIEVDAGQNYTLRLDIYISESRPSDVYLGQVRFLTKYISRESDVILDVKEVDALFDIRTEVLKKYINPGGRIRANISIINMGSLRNFDVSLEYMIVDFENNNYTLKKEDFAIDQVYFNIFYLDVPKDIPMGDYVFYARVSYKDVGASSFDTFTVEGISLLAWIVVILVILIIIFLIIRRLTRDKRLAKKALKEQQRKTRIKKPPLIRRILRVPRLG